MRACLSQGRGLVNNLAGLLGDQVGLRARIGAPKAQRLRRMTASASASKREVKAVAVRRPRRASIAALATARN